MELVLVGINHETAPVELRQCLAPEADQVPARLAQVLSLNGVSEAFMVATCNRVEVLVLAEEGPRAAQDLAGWLAKSGRVAPGELTGALYRHQGSAAVRHLFRVASSLDSLVLGEPQILGQIKEAYRIAAESGASRAVLNRLLHKAFMVAKRVRSETQVGGAALSIAHAAVDLACKIFDPLAESRALLIGAGEMAELAAEHLLGHGLQHLTVANRTLERALELAQRFGAQASGLDDLADSLAASEIVITSTGAPQPLVSRDLARSALRRRRGRPIFFIDIAVPRDVAPEVAELDGCFVYDIDDLGQVVEANRDARQEEAKKAEGIVEQEVAKFNNWLAGLAVVPTIAALSAKGEEIRQAELERSLKGLGPISPGQEAVLQRLTKALVKKLLHDPIVALKEVSRRSPQAQRHYLATTRRLFKLPDQEED